MLSNACLGRGFDRGCTATVDIGALVKGLEDRQLDALPIILYRTMVNDPQDSHTYLLESLTISGCYDGVSLLEPCAEMNMLNKVDVLLEDKQEKDGGILFSAVIDLSANPLLLPECGDDAVREFAFFDNSPTPNDKQTQTLPATGIDLNGPDCYFMAEHLKTLGWVNRGVSHPTDPKLACDDDEKDDPAEVRPWAKGGRVWGRPINSVEFVAAAGVEKIVASAGFSHLRQPEKQVSVEQGAEWLFPGKTESRDHILVKSTADLVYLGGHYGGLGGRWRGHRYGTTAPKVYMSPLADENPTPCVVPSDHWTLHQGVQEIEWLILIACWGLNDGPAAQNWSNEMAQLKLRGMLGFHGRGWSGRREGLAFLHFSSYPSEGTLESISVENGKSILLLRESAARVLPEGFEVEHSGDYNRMERAPFRTFSPGDSILIDAQQATIEDIDVTDSPTPPRGKIFLGQDIGAHAPGTPVQSIAPSFQRGWRIAWGGLARDLTKYLNYEDTEPGAVPSASVVHPSAVGDGLGGTWIDADPTVYEILKYHATLGKNELPEHEVMTWQYIEKDLAP